MFGKGHCSSREGGMGMRGFGPFGGWGGPGHGGGGPMAAILHGLNLTDEQLMKIAEIKGGSFTQAAHNKIDTFELKKQIFKELLKPQVDRNKVHEIAKQIKEKKEACMATKLDNIIAIAEILTPEQKKQIALNKIRCFLGMGGEDEGDDDE